MEPVKLPCWNLLIWNWILAQAALYCCLVSSDPSVKANEPPFVEKSSLRCSKRFGRAFSFINSICILTLLIVDLHPMAFEIGGLVYASILNLSRTRSSSFVQFGLLVTPVALYQIWKVIQILSSTNSWILYSYTFFTVFLFGLLVIDLSNDLFSRAHEEVQRVFEYYTVIFQYRVSYTVVSILFMQPIIGLYLYMTAEGNLMMISVAFWLTLLGGFANIYNSFFSTSVYDKFPVPMQSNPIAKKSWMLMTVSGVHVGMCVCLAATIHLLQSSLLRA